jgi:ABC-type branched-subunit amino acid transport system ATPase component
MTQLTVEDISLRFGGVKTLLGVSFAATPGEVLAIISTHGAGKTTPLNAISGVHRPYRRRKRWPS